MTAALRAQTPAPSPDVLVFKDDERLIGHFVQSNGNSLMFHSDSIGDVTVDWSKVKELRTNGRVAVVQKGVELRKRQNVGTLPQGTLDMTEQTLHLQPAPAAPPVTIPVANADHVLSQDTLQKVLHPAGFFASWKGALTGGITLVDATQQSRTFNGAATLVRTVPSETWVAPSNRTLLTVNGSYGKVTQPNTPSVKTEIYFIDAERDEYFSKKAYVFGEAAFNHNFSQGLDLAQRYSAGIGWTVLEKPNEELDLKGSAGYINQKFADGAQNESLVGSTLEQAFRRTFVHGMLFQERISITGTWNNLQAYFGSANATLTIPVYHRFASSFGFLDTFLNDPPPGFKKNSLQFTLGITYTLP